MKRSMWAAGAAIAIATSAAAATTPPPADGFAAFYKLFAAAAAKDDQKTLAGFTVVSAELDPTPPPLTFAKFHKRYLTAKERRCLARGKPERDIDGTGAVNYSVFCGQLIYGFTKPTSAGWRLTYLSPDD